MTDIIVTRGLPGSGKSTWAKEWVAADPDNRVRANRDDIRMTMFGTTRGVDEDLVTQVETRIVEAAVEAGKAVVVDAMHLRAQYVKKWASLGNVVLQDFPVPVDVCVERDAARAAPVGEGVIRGIAKRYHIPSIGTLPSVDLAGTEP